MIPFERIVDRYVGTILCSILGVLSQKNANIPKQVNKIIIIKLWAVGESILTLPMIRLLKKRYPNARIDVLTRRRNKDVYLDNTDISSVYLLEEFPLHLFRKYDLSFDCEPYLNLSAILSFLISKVQVGFDYGIRSRLYNKKVVYNDKQHVVQTYVDLLSDFDVTKKPNQLVHLSYPLSAKRKVFEIFSKNKIAKTDFLVGFCVGSAESGQGRKWPIEQFTKLADILIEKYDAKIILTGSKGEFALNETMVNLINQKNKKNLFNFVGLTDLKELFALVERCTLFISNDTGTMHVAAAQGVKTIGLFGPNTPVRFGPFGKGNGFVYKPTLPDPCINVHKGIIPDCKNHFHMEKISVDDVLKEVKKIVRK